MGKPWREDEIEIIRTYWKVESDTELMNRLPGRTRTAIEHERIRQGWIKTRSKNIYKAIIEDQRRLRSRIGG